MPAAPYGIADAYVAQSFPATGMPPLRPAAQAYPPIPTGGYPYPGAIPGVKPAAEAYPMISVSRNLGYQPSFVPRPGSFQQTAGYQPYGKGGKGKGRGYGKGGSTANAANAIPLGRERTWGSGPEELDQPVRAPSPVHRPVQVIGRGRALTVPAWAQKAAPGQREDSRVIDVTSERGERVSTRDAYKDSRRSPYRDSRRSPDRKSYRSRDRSERVSNEKRRSELSSSSRNDEVRSSRRSSPRRRSSPPSRRESPCRRRRSRSYDRRR